MVDTGVSQTFTLPPREPGSHREHCGDIGHPTLDLSFISVGKKKERVRGKNVTKNVKVSVRGKNVN